MHLEVELKLEPDDETALDALIRALDLGAPGLLKLRATYFDTPDLALAHKGHVLRVRQEGGRRVQTVKGPGRPGDDPLARQEWECPVAGPDPVLDADNPVRALLGERIADLAPRFEIRNDRSLWRIEHDGADIEMVLDRAEAHAGDRMNRFVEIELELKAGDPAALFALARRIDRLTPVRLGMLAKAERAQRLLDAPARSDHAEPVPLSAEMNATDAFRRIAHGCLRHYRLNEARLLREAIDDDSRAALHQARVALRRLRTALRLFAPIAGRTKRKRFDADLRWLAHQLAAARMIDVALTQVTTPEARATLETARASAYAQARFAMRSPLARALLLDLAEWLSVGRWTGRNRGRRETARAYARRAIARLHADLLRREPAVAGPDDEARHAARRAAKRLRYAIDFFAPLFDSDRQRKARLRLLAALEEVQGALGALNDRRMLPVLLGPLGLPAGGATPEERAAELTRAAEGMAGVRAAAPFWE